MNLAEMRVELLERTGLLPRDQMAQPDTLTRQLNTALHWIDDRQPAGWPWLRFHDLPVTLTAGQGSYPFADISGFLTWRKVRSVRLTNSVAAWPLLRVNLATIETQASQQPTITPGAPELWATDGYNLIFGPPPNAGFLDALVDVTANEPDLVADGDTPLMPSSFHDAIVERAAYLMHRRTGDQSKANAAASSAQDLLVAMRGFGRAETGAMHVQTRDDAPF